MKKAEEQEKQEELVSLQKITENTEISKTTFDTPRFTQLLKMSGAILKNRISFKNPLMLMHSVTEACNAKCPYCVFRHGKGRPNEMSLDEISSLYKEAEKLSMQYVHIWGGEPLIHPKISQILTLAKESRLITGLVTNGAFLRKKADDIIPKLDRLYISLDYPGPYHNTLRETPGLYEATIEGVKYIRSKWKDQPIVVSFTLMKDNADAIVEMAALCSEIGARLYVNPMRETSNSDSDQISILQNKEVFEVNNSDRIIKWTEQSLIWEQLIQLKRQGYPIQNSMYYMKMLAKTGKSPTYKCHWPKIAIGIESNGDIADCQRWGNPISNVREQSLKGIVQLPRMKELYGACGEACNECASPARVEPSKFWDLHVGMILQTVQSMVFGASVPKKE